MINTIHDVWLDYITMFHNFQLPTISFHRAPDDSNDHNGHKPICRSLTAPAATGSSSGDEQPGTRTKIPVGARVSAPLLGISSGGKKLVT